MQPIHIRKRRSAASRLAAVAALGFAAACGAPLLATETATEPVPTPIRCGVATDSHGRMVAFRPWVRADAGLTGHYRFALHRAGTSVEQGGDFDGAGNRPVRLGEAILPGPAESYELQMTVAVAGETYACHAAEDEI